MNIFWVIGFSKSKLPRRPLPLLPFPRLILLLHLFRVFLLLQLVFFLSMSLTFSFSFDLSFFRRFFRLLLRPLLTRVCYQEMAQKWMQG